MNIKSVGSINIILGPMFSGKSTELIKNIRKYTHKKKRTILIKYSFDNRYSLAETVVTHDKYEHPACNAKTLTEMKDIFKDYDVIGIDEGQFFSDLTEICEELANSGKIVFISALNANFKRESFETIIKIIPKCDSIIYLKSICGFCEDANDASFTLRIVENKDEVLIGGIEAYKPCCRNCYNIQMENMSNQSLCKSK
jgi:thymidine kinase